MAQKVAAKMRRSSRSRFGHISVYCCKNLRILPHRIEHTAEELKLNLSIETKECIS